MAEILRAGEYCGDVLDSGVMGPGFDRRAFLLGMGGLGIMGTAEAMGATMLVPEIGGIHSKPPLPPGVYVPAWQDPDIGLSAEANGRKWDATYRDLAKMLPKGQGNPLYVSFAEPDPAAEGLLRLPIMTRPLMDLVRGRQASLAVGGYGASQLEHSRILRGWGAAFEQPGPFVDNLVRVVGELGLKGVSLDMEYPTKNQGRQLADMAKRLRAKLPRGARLTVAVPADSKSEHAAGFREAVNKHGLVEVADAFDVMAYDQHTPQSHRSGNLATGAWVINSLSGWCKLVGASKVRAGFATYGYRYKGARKAGQAFTQAEEIWYKDTHKRVRDHKDNTSSAIIDGSWASLQSPAVVRKLFYLAHAMGIPGAFFWSGQGLTRSYLDAVSRR